MTTRFKPSIIANAFLHKANVEGASLSHLQLQKLVYFTHAWSITISGKSVVSEDPEAWEYGPTFESLFHHLKGYGNEPVSKYLEQFNPVSGKMESMIPPLNNPQEWIYIDQVWSRYGRFSAVQLSNLASEAGGPWQMARDAKVLHIAHSDILEFFSGKLARYKHDQAASASKQHLRLVQ